MLGFSSGKWSISPPPPLPRSQISKALPPTGSSTHSARRNLSSRTRSMFRATMLVGSSFLMQEEIFLEIYLSGCRWCMLFPILERRGRIILFPRIFRSVRTKLLSMAASNDEGNKENVANGEAEQIVTMEKVIAADNKGIDYDKLISECSLPFLFIFFSLVKLLNAQSKVLH